MTNEETVAAVYVSEAAALRRKIQRIVELSARWGADPATAPYARELNAVLGAKEAR